VIAEEGKGTSDWSGRLVGGVGEWGFQELRVGIERDTEAEGMMPSGCVCV